MKNLLPTLFAASLFSAGLGLHGLALAGDYEHHGMHKGGHHDGHHGYGHGDGYGCRKTWMEGLSDEQRKQLDKLHEDYYKDKRKIKDTIRDAKVELAREITTDSPKQKSINKKIDAVVELKRKKIRLKAEHHIAVRKLLNAEQKKKFDEYLMNKAKYHRRGKGYHHR